MRFALAVLMLAGGFVAGAVVVDDEVKVQGEYLVLVLAPGEAGTITEFAHRATVGNFAGEGGLLQEGFGVGSFYVPNRRLNEKLEIVDAIQERPVVRYSYDCDGPNIRGLHVTRTMEPIPDEASLRVTWRIENRGHEAQWVAPWVRNEIAPGGRFDEHDRLDVPTLEGIHQAGRTAYYPASRNWAAATDPIEKVTVCGVFNADHTHSFFTLWDPEGQVCGFQTAFVPRLFKPEDAWESVYRINVLRGLSHVDFAGDALAVQIDYREPGKLEVLIATVKAMPNMRVRARILAENGDVWRLPDKRFSIDPDKLVRCSYQWEPPGDGVYDFLAQLAQNDEPYPLGQDTASPHGGIDTQFVVGRPPEVDMAAWTDAPFALERSGRTLNRTMACPGDTAIWFESALEKVFREDIPQAMGPIDPTVRIGLARNERESFQLILRPPKGTDIHNVACHVHDLVNRTANARITPSNVEVCNVTYYPVRVPTNFEGPTGDWPDALPPFEPFTAKGGQCSPVWFTVYAPENLPAGKYAGMLELTAASLEPVELWIEAVVYDFVLPKTPALKTDFGFWPEAAMEAAKRLGYVGSPENLWATYLENALQHRVTLRELTQFPAESAHYAVDLEAFAPRIKKLLECGVSCVAVPATLLEAPDQLRQANTFVVERQLQDRVFCQIASEPPPPSWPRLLERMQHWKDTAPDIPLMATTVGLEPFIPEPLDIWDVHLQILDTPNNKTLLERVRAGHEVWWYVNHCPPRPYGNFFIDFAAIEHRILFWQTWALGLRGFHYWSVNYCERGQDPWVNQLDITPANGNGFLIYPGPKGPVNSIRWETIRDGIEDYDYLVILMNRIRRLQVAPSNSFEGVKGGHKALFDRAADALNLQELVPDLVTFPRNAELLSAKRAEIARTIIELGRALKD